MIKKYLVTILFLLVFVSIIIIPVSAGYSQIGTMTIPYGNNTTHGGASFTSFGDSFTVINPTQAYNYFRKLEYSAVYDVNDWAGIDHSASDHVDLMKTGSIKIGEGDMSYTLGDVDSHGQTAVNMVLENITLTAPPAGDGFISPIIHGGGGDFVSVHRTNPFAITTWSPVTSSPSGDNNFYIYTGVPASLATPGIYTTYTDSYQTNVHITVLENTTSFDGTHHPIPRANVVVTLEEGSTASGQTDLNGNISFLSSTINRAFQPYINVTKAGYQDGSLVPTWSVLNPDNYAIVYLLDYAPPAGANAIVYVDLVDLNTGAGIGGCQVGIQNTTATVNQWYYFTEPNTTALFTKTGIWPDQNNLSIGQVVQFSGYKPSAYQANNSGLYTIPSAISHTALYLLPVSGNVSASIFYPVVVADAITGNAIANSWLAVTGGKTGFSPFHNQTSSTGQFNVTGKGANGDIPLEYGDILTFDGNATGYLPNGYALIVDTSNVGTPQIVSLAPEGYTPLPGEFIAIFNVYDSTTTLPIGGARISITPGIQNGTTNSNGALAVFNVSTNTLYSASITYPGYQSVTKTFSSTASTVKNIDVPMAKTAVTPTLTNTWITTVPTTIVHPTTTGGKYVGFWSPFYNGFKGMGASEGELNLLLTLVFVIAGAIITARATGWSPWGFNSGAAAGFIFACAFGLIYFWLIMAGVAWLLLPLVFRRTSG